MRNKQSGTLGKTAKFIAKVMCFAILFSLVFGIVFTSDAVLNLSSSILMQDSPNAYASGYSTKILEPSVEKAVGDIELNASNFKDGVNTFPNGSSGTWTMSTNDSNKLLFNNTNNWRNSISVRVDMQKRNKENEISIGGINIVNQPQWNDTSPYTSENNEKDGHGGNVKYGRVYAKEGGGTYRQGRGFTLQANDVKGNAVIGAALKIENSPFIEQLIHDNRYTVQAKVTQKVHHLQTFAWEYCFLPIKVQTLATTPSFQAKDFSEFNGGEANVFKTSDDNKTAAGKKYPSMKLSDTWRDGDVEKAGHHERETSPGIYLGNFKGKEMARFQEISSDFVTLDTKTPDLTCMYLCGCATDNKGNNIFRCWDMAVEYKITKNANSNNGDVVRDGASPRPVYANNALIKPFSPTADANSWPVYNADNKEFTDAFSKVAPTDSVYADFDKKIPNDVVVLSSYVKKTNSSDVWKTITMEYEDKYFYAGNTDNSINPEKYAGGIKSVKFSGLIPDNKTNNQIKFDSPDGQSSKEFLISSFTETETINMFLRGNNVGSIVVTKLENTSQANKTNRISIKYDFKENITLNISVTDFSDIDTENQMEQTIVVNGIDGTSPQPLRFNETDKNMMSSVPSNITKWYENPFANFSLDPNDTTDVSDLGNAKYAWFVQVIKSNTGFDDAAFNNYEKATDVAAILGETFLQIQGISPFVNITYDFTSGMFDVNGTKSASTKKTGSGYYGFFFYTIDLAGNTLAQPLKVFLKADYIAPKYVIKTDAPDNYFNKVNGANSKVSGSKWSYKDFRLVLEILDPQNQPLDSFSGNYIKFMYNDRENTLAFNKDGFIRYNDYVYDAEQDAFVTYDRNGVIVDTKTEYSRQSIELINFKIWFWGKNTTDPTNVLVGNNDNNAKPFTNTATQIIFEFGKKEPKVQNSIAFKVGIGDGTSSTLEWFDPEYKHKKYVDSSNAQEKGVKILVDTTIPNGVNPFESEMMDGLLTLNSYQDLVTNTVKFNSRKWNTTGNMDLKMAVDQGSTVFIIVSNMNNLVDKYIAGSDYSGEVEAQDKYLQKLLEIFGSDINNPTRLTSTSDEVEKIIHNIFRTDIPGYPYPAMVLSSADTTRGQIAVNIPMFMEQFGNGLRNIYMFTVNESGRMSKIKTGSVLVDTRTYTIESVINATTKQHFPNITKEQANVYLTKSGNLVETTQFKRGDIVKFNFNFDSVSDELGLGFVPYSLTGRSAFGDKKEDVLFYNSAVNAEKPLWGTTWKSTGDNLYINYDANKGIQLRVDSLDNIVKTLIPSDSEGNQQKVTYTLDIRKNVNFGISGLAIDNEGKYVGNIVIRQNANGADAPFWATDMDILNSVKLGKNALSIVYKLNGVDLKGKPTGVSSETDTYTVSAEILLDNEFYVSNITNLKDIPLIIKLQKLQIVVKPSYGYYGETPTISYELRDNDGKLVTLADISANNGKEVKNADIISCLLVDNQYDYSQNRIPIGTYNVVANKLKIGEVFVNDSYEVSVIGNTYEIQPKTLIVDGIGMINNGKVSWGINYKFMAKRPEICFFINQQQLAGFEKEFRSIFYNCDYVPTTETILNIPEGLNSNTYYVFKDTYDSIRPVKEITKYSLPGKYSLSRDTSAFNMSSNFKLSLPTQQFETIEQRSSLVITPETQSIYLPSTDERTVFVDNRLIKYSLDSENKDLLNESGYIDLSDFNQISKLQFKLEKGTSSWNIIDVIIPDEISAGFSNPIATLAKLENITVEFMGVSGNADNIIYVRQNNALNITYDTLTYGIPFYVGTNPQNVEYPNIKLPTFYNDFEFILYQKENGQYVKKGIDLLKLELVLKIEDAEKETQKVGVGSYFADKEVKCENITLAGEPLKNVSVAAGNNSIRINIVPKVLYAVPVLRTDKDGKFGMPYYSDVNDDKINIDNILLDNKNEVFTPAKPSDVSGQFERAVFDSQGFVKYGHYTDGILLDSNLYYGIIEKEPFTINDGNYIIKYDENKPVYKYVENGEKVVTDVMAKDVKLDIFKTVIAINYQNFVTTNFVEKTYDGTNIYFIDDYSSLLSIQSIFYDNYIKYDIRYSGDGSDTNGLVDIIIDNFRIAGNEEKAINFIMPENLTFTFKDRHILPKEVVLSANDIKVIKEFDGSNKVYNKDIVLPESIKNVPFDVETVGGENTNVLDTMYIGDFNKINDFVIVFKIKSNVGLLNFDVSSDNTITMEPTDGNTIKLRIANKQAVINRVKVGAKDFATVTAAQNRSYEENNTSIDLLFTFTNEFKSNKLQNLQEIYNYITDEIGLKLVGTVFKDGLATDQAGQNMPVKIEKALTIDGKDYNSNNTFFEIDLDDLKNKYNNIITANINKALISLDVPHKTYNYGDTVEIMDSTQVYNIKHGTRVIASISGATAELWNKNKQDNNVNGESLTYQHNIMVTGKLSLNIEENKANNYILAGYVYVDADNGYRLLEVVDHSLNLVNLSKMPQIKFQVKDAVVVLPKEIALNNKIFNGNNVTMLNGQLIQKEIDDGQGNKTKEFVKASKVFDGNSDAKFIYSINQEAELAIYGSYNSMNAAEIKPISINKVEVVAKDNNNPDCVNNYVIKNDLRSINGEITKRPVEATSITLEDFAFEGSFGIANEFVDNLYLRETDVTHNDITSIIWANTNGKIDGQEQSGFVGDDINHIKITIHNLQYKTPTANLAVRYDENGKLLDKSNEFVNNDVNPTRTFEITDDLQYNINNYELKCSNIIGRIIPKDIYVELQLTNQPTKVYDGGVAFSADTNMDYNLVIPGKSIEEVEPIKNSISVTGEFENANSGKRKIELSINWNNAGESFKNFRLVNSGVKSTYGSIEQRTIYFGLEEITKVYGDTSITPNYVFYTEEEGTVPYRLNEDGVPVDKDNNVIFHKEFGKNVLTKAQMPTLPNVALCYVEEENTSGKIELIEKYKSVDNGSKEKNIIFIPHGKDATEAIGDVNNTERKIYVYTNGSTKAYGKPNPTPALSISGSSTEFVKGLVNRDNYRSIFYDETKQEYLLKGVYKLYEIKDDEGKVVQYIYALGAQYNDKDLMTEAEVDNQIKNGAIVENPNKIAGKYDIYLHDGYQSDKQQLGVTLPKLNLTMKDAVSVDYTSSDLITSIFNQSIDGLNLVYTVEKQKVLEDGQVEFEVIPDVTQLTDVGTYKITAKASRKANNDAQTSLDAIQTDDQKVIGLENMNVEQEILTGLNSGKNYSMLTITPIRPSLYFENDKQFNLNDPINDNELINKLLSQTNLSEEQVKLLRESVRLTKKYRTFDSSKYEDFNGASFNKAGFYELLFTLNIDNLPNYKYGELDTNGIAIKGYIQVAKGKVIMLQDPIEENLAYEEGKTDYVKGSLATTVDGHTLKAQYVGGLSNDYEFEVHSIGTYKYRFVLVDNEGNYDPNYDVYVNEDGVERRAEGRNLKIGRKEISDKLNSGNNVTIKSSAPIDVEYMTYDVLLDSGQMGWSEVNNYVNNMPGLNSSYSKLAAVVNLGYKVSNGQDATGINATLDYTVNLPEVLDTAAELQVFYRNNENKLVALEGYHISDGVLTFSSTPVEQLVFVTEQKPELPVWGIVLIVFAVLGFVGISTAIAIVAIKSKKGLIK